MRLAPFSIPSITRPFQFTHPGGVRLVAKMTLTEIQRVSIHAPGRGATRSWSIFAAASITVSIHAPGRGATLPTGGALSFRAVSIHAPGRGATDEKSGITAIINVSIHAPGRGATWRPQTRGHERDRFQFTHPGGVRRKLVGLPPINWAFQFTHPGGVRHISEVVTTALTEFQFTHPGGVRRRWCRWCC